MGLPKWRASLKSICQNSKILKTQARRMKLLGLVNIKDMYNLRGSLIMGPPKF